MRLGTVLFEGRSRVVAALDDDMLLDLDCAAQYARYETRTFTNMLAVIEEGDYGLEQAEHLLRRSHRRALLKMADVTFLPPLMPVQYRDCLAFGTQERGGSTLETPPRHPVYCKGNRLSFVGHGADVAWPHYARHLDIGLGLAIVIGKQGKDISAAEAPEYIYGYSILNDIVARDTQMAEMAGQMGPAKGKDFDTGNILGPFILTADEVTHPAALVMEARVNGVRWGGANARDMHHDFGAILAHISAAETIYPGEVIGSGTMVSGLELGRQLAPGDRFELEIEGIGTLANRIMKES